MTDQNELIREIIGYRGRIAKHEKRLEHFGFKVFSQSDEDGILEEIFKRVGTTTKTFVEFGAEAGQENNSRYLLMQGWKGLWIEGNPSYAPVINSYYEDEILSGQLSFIDGFVNVDNINSLIESAGFEGEIDFLSVDIDGNDYHVFRAISVINPRVICLEYNPFYLPPQEWVMPYDPEYRWDHTANYGASIFSFEKLADEKDYILVGCGLYSSNSFYIRKDLFESDLFPFPLGCQNLMNTFNHEKIVSFPTGSHLFVQDDGELYAERLKFELLKNKYVSTKELFLSLKNAHIQSEAMQQHKDVIQAEIQAQLEGTKAQLQLARSRSEAMQQHMDMLQSQLYESQTQVTNIENQLHESQTQVADIENCLHLAEAESARSQSELLRKIQKLRGKKKGNQEVFQKRYQTLKRHLEQTLREKEDCNREIEAMKSSKFWKLRSLWQRIKHPFAR